MWSLGQQKVTAWEIVFLSDLLDHSVPSPNGAPYCQVPAGLPRNKYALNKHPSKLSFIHCFIVFVLPLLSCKSFMMMLVQKCRKVFALLIIASAVMAQDYPAQDYPEYTDYADNYGSQDNLYHDYAQRQGEKGYVCRCFPRGTTNGTFFHSMDTGSHLFTFIIMNPFSTTMKPKTIVAEVWAKSWCVPLSHGF